MRAARCAACLLVSHTTLHSVACSRRVFVGWCAAHGRRHCPALDLGLDRRAHVRRARRAQVARGQLPQSRQALQGDARAAEA